jgi:hypothetical protein
MDDLLTIGGILVQPADTPKKMRWNAAMQYAEELGDAWRLPTFDEFKAILKENKKSKVTAFQKDYYWCSEEVYSGSRDAITMHVGKESKYEDTKTCLSFVRLVKDLEVSVEDPLETVLLQVNSALTAIISTNEKELSEEMDYKVITNYGYGKFYLGKLDGSYDMSIYALIHYILHDDKLYRFFLTKKQLKDVDNVIKENPEGIYSPKEADDNFEYVQYEVLDNIFSRGIACVREELKKRSFSTSAFDTALGID